MRTLEQIRMEGFTALLNTLGPVDAMRFLQQFSQGYGDYTKERHAWLDNKSWEELTERKKVEQS
jgi:hypothetical protein